MAALRAGLITVAILLGLGFALAQQGENLASPQQKSQQEKAQQKEDGRAGTTEPSSHTPTAPPDASWVFQNGKLVTPGAPADSQTVPAKFSERNNALDELPTMAFPLPLTDDQRQRIRDAVSKTPVANADDAFRRIAAERRRGARVAGSSDGGDSGRAQPQLCAHQRRRSADQPGQSDCRRRDRSSRRGEVGLTGSRRREPFRES